MAIDPVMGVDPGVNGGISVLSGEGAVIYVAAFRPDMTEDQLYDVIAPAAAMAKICFFEKVGYMPKDGGKGAFTFGAINGLLRGMLIALKVKRVYVAPMMWQAALGCLTGGNKNVSKRRAQDLFPAVKMTHSVADSLLIAYYGLRRQPQ